MDRSGARNSSRDRAAHASDPGLVRTRYRDLDARFVPEPPRLDGTLTSLLRELAPTVESARVSRPRKSPAPRPGAARDSDRDRAEDATETERSNPAISRAAARGTSRLEEVSEIWQRTVGEDIAGLSRPTRFRAGVLTVELDSAPLAAELDSFARDHLLEALAGEGLSGLCDLKFKVRA